MPIHSLILSLNDTTKTHNSPIHSHANRAASKSRMALAWRDKIRAMVGIKLLFVMRGFFGDFLLMTIFLLTLMLIADRSFYSVV